MQNSAKRWAALLLVVCMLSSLLVPGVFATEETFVAEGKITNTATWGLTAAGVLKITGSGWIPHYDDGYTPWVSYKSAIKEVQVEGISNISRQAFAGYTNIEKVTLGETVTMVDAYCFAGCTALTEVAMLGVKTLNGASFINCTALATVQMADSLEVLGSSSFEGCTALTEATVPANVYWVGQNAFAACLNLEEVTFLGETAPQIHERGVFYKVSARINTPASWDPAIMKNYHGALAWNKNVVAGGYSTTLCWQLTEDGVLQVTSLALMQNFTKNGTPWNAYSDQITSMAIEGAAIVGTYIAYGLPKLESVTFPADLLAIRGYTFANCTSLKSVTVPGGVGVIDGAAFLGCTALEEVVLEEGVRSLATSTFEGCTALTSITFPSTLKGLSPGAFAAARNLKDITFLGNAPTIGANAFLYVIANVQYDEENTTWTAENMLDYGGTLTWGPIVEEEIPSVDVGGTEVEDGDIKVPGI